MKEITSQEFLGILGIESEEYFIHNAEGFIWGDTSNEGKLSFILSLIKNKFHDGRILEFGTYRGSTTDKISDVLGDGEIYTVDCGFEALKKMLVAESAEHNDKVKYSEYVVGEVYKRNKRINVRQIIGNTKDYIVKKHIVDSGPFDLIYIDAAHTYDGIGNDTRISFDSISKDGIIIWDDYNSHWTGVNNFLNDLSKDKSLYYLRDNRFVVYVNSENK